MKLHQKFIFTAYAVVTLVLVALVFYRAAGGAIFG
jgi:hypothetical protein